ncbi:MAG: hypothetical protein OK452_08445 [Thaumarchaeota archaeon]|nr:hypothetical protein [Nitrososphaerota archaeon]
MAGDVPETNELELLAFVMYCLKIQQSLFVCAESLETMCDCSEYEFEEMALEKEEKEPETIAVPVQLVRAKKK